VWCLCDIRAVVVEWADDEVETLRGKFELYVSVAITERAIDAYAAVQRTMGAMIDMISADLDDVKKTPAVIYDKLVAERLLAGRVLYAL
jgi:hypothetical protein